MEWNTWIKVFGQKPPVELTVGDMVYFRRGNAPELGWIVAAGNEIRVPLVRCGEDGKPLSRRRYWRNRSQLYVRR